MRTEGRVAQSSALTAQSSFKKLVTFLIACVNPEIRAGRLEGISEPQSWLKGDSSL